jgi:uncharacterized SAM-binding protein YcdF (DUF218 family)
VAQRRFGFFPKLFALALLLAVAAFFTWHLWMPVFGYALIHDDGPIKADIAVVLAGDATGKRIEKAAQLIKAGYVPSALIDGPEGQYGFDEAELAIPFIVKEGYPSAWFIPFPIDAHSTKEEAQLILNELRRRNVHSFLLVTSDYHSGRSRRIFLAAEKGLGFQLPFNTVTAPDKYFRADRWWWHRESEKTVFMEWSKTLSTALGN